MLGGGGGPDTARCSWWEPQGLGEVGECRGALGPLRGVPEPYLNFLMFFSDTRMKSTMG